MFLTVHVDNVLNGYRDNYILSIFTVFLSLYLLCFCFFLLFLSLFPYNLLCLCFFSSLCVTLQFTIFLAPLNVIFYFVLWQKFLKNRMILIWENFLSLGLITTYDCNFLLQFQWPLVSKLLTEK